MRWGILLTALGVACYIVHAMLLNYFLRKNAPEVLARDPGSARSQGSNPWRGRSQEDNPCNT